MKENIAMLGMQIEKAKTGKKSLCIALVDLKKAFDTVDSSFLVEYVERIGWERKCLGC